MSVFTMLFIIQFHSFYFELIVTPVYFKTMLTIQKFNITLKDIFFHIKLFKPYYTNM